MSGSSLQIKHEVIITSNKSEVITNMNCIKSKAISISNQFSLSLHPASMSNKRKILTLEERVKVLQRADKGEKPAAIASSIGCGRT